MNTRKLKKKLLKVNKEIENEENKFIYFYF